MLSFFPRDVLGEIWDLIESVSEGFPTYKHGVIKVVSLCKSGEKLWSCIPISEIIQFAPLATPLFSLKRHSHWRSSLKEAGSLLKERSFFWKG